MANQSDPKLAQTQFILLDGKKELLQPLNEALKARGYRTRLFHNPDEALSHLSKTDVLLIMDATVAGQPKSSKLIKASTILVLTNNSRDTLPPWLEARHVYLLTYPQEPSELIDRLSDYTAPHSLELGVELTDTKHIALLFSITQSLSGQLDIYELFERILTLAPYLGGDFTAILVQENDETIYYRSSWPGCEDLTGAAGRYFAERLLEEGMEGWVLERTQTVLLPNIANDSRWFRASYLPEPQGSAVALPLKLERAEARGVYLIGHEQTGRFTPKDLPLLEAVVPQMAMAIENALLYKSQLERSVQLSLINEVSQAATSILNLDGMLRTVVQAIRRSFAFHSVSIHLYNSRTKQVELRARVAPDHYGPVPKEARFVHNLKEGLIGWAAATNKTILVNDVAQDPRYKPTIDNKDIRAELCVPITLGIKTIGVLDLQSTQLEAFHKHHASALGMLVDQLAIAIENARLYDEINQRVQELKSLYEIGQAITSTLDLQKTLTLIADHTTRLMGVAAASVALRDDETSQVWFAAAFGAGSDAVIDLRMPLGQGLAGWVADRGEPVIVPNVRSDPRFFAEVDKTSGFTTKSILCVPLQTRGQTIGAIEVMNKKKGTFNKEDLSLLQALATSAATAIENAKLYEEKIRTIDRLAESQRQNVQLIEQTEALRAFNEDIIQNMTNGLIAVNQEKYVTAFNPAAASMLGCQTEAVLNQPLQTALNGAHKLIEIFDKTLATGQPYPHQELTVRHWDGTQLPISISTAPLVTMANDKPTGVVGVLEDLSELKALEAERRRLDRLAALGEMSAVVAHEIRNPIAGIAAGIEYLTRNVPKDSPDFEGVVMIQGEIERVNHILEDILFVARPLKLSLSSEKLPDIINSVIQRNRAWLEQNQVTVSCEYQDSFPAIKVDRQRLEQVFTNLAVNAVQAMDGGGQLLWQAGHTRPVKEDHPGQTVVTISDTGPGIPSDIRRRIFEPFFTTKVKGTGLGLPVARRIVEAHGGTIDVASKPGEGTRFIIELPLERSNSS